jgi:hypothetical protein
MKKVGLTITTIMVAILAIMVINKTLMFKHGDSDISSRIYRYMKSGRNQRKVFKDAIALNNNNSSNACVYFVAEVLRKNDISVAKETANTTQLINVLKNRGWKKDNNYKNLNPGDIVFTTDSLGNKNGVPSHAYVFMGWVNEGSYDYAYICDNQARDYKNKVYNIRNIKNRDTVNGISKDAFSFFMKF